MSRHKRTHFNEMTSAIFLSSLLGVLVQVYSQEDPPARFLLNDPNHLGVNNRIYIGFNNISIINIALPMIILAHGYTENSSTYYYKDMPDEYAKKGDYNVIGVDWGKLASGFYIFTAIPSSRVAGEYLGQFLIQLHGIGLDLQRVHIVGHSLGGHVAGFAGKYVRKELGLKVGRITGLEPGSLLLAGVLADTPDDRLSDGDAETVQVLHTDGFGFGIYAPIGTVDFYANGGISPQPGCPNPNRTFYLNFYCSHQMSVLFYIESINSYSFISCSKNEAPCIDGNQTIFGENLPSGNTGIFYFNTNKDPPYAQG